MLSPWWQGQPRAETQAPNLRELALVRLAQPLPSQWPLTLRAASGRTGGSQVCPPPAQVLPPAPSMPLFLLLVTPTGSRHPTRKIAQEDPSEPAPWQNLPAPPQRTEPAPDAPVMGVSHTYRGEVPHGVTDVQHGQRSRNCTRWGAGVPRGEAWVWVAREGRGRTAAAGQGGPWLGRQEPGMLRNMWAVCWHVGCSHLP